jgi:hypothetical protein
VKCIRCQRECKGDVVKYYDKHIEFFTCECGNIWSRELTDEDMKILHEMRKL